MDTTCRGYGVVVVSYNRSDRVFRLSHRGLFLIFWPKVWTTLSDHEARSDRSNRPGRGVVTGTRRPTGDTSFHGPSTAWYSRTRDWGEGGNLRVGWPLRPSSPSKHRRPRVRYVSLDVSSVSGGSSTSEDTVWSIPRRETDRNSNTLSLIVIN